MKDEKQIDNPHQIQDNIDLLLAGNPERIEMYRNDPMFFAGIQVLARGGDVVDILFQVCKNAKESNIMLTKHMELCSSPNFNVLIPE